MSAFRTAVEAKDVDAMTAALHLEARFFSPAVFRPYEGRDRVMELLAHVLEVLEDFRYMEQLEGDGSCGLVFKARTGEARRARLGPTSTPTVRARHGARR